MFGFKRRRAAKAAAEANAAAARLDAAKREALAQKHLQAQHSTSRVPFSKRADVQQVVRAKDADTVQQATTNSLLDPASPLYAGAATGHSYQSPAAHHDPACNAGAGTASHHTTQDYGSSYGGGGSGGGCD